MLNREPVLLLMVIAPWLIGRGLEYLNVIPPTNVTEALAELAVFVLLWLGARAKVFSEKTLTDAGLNPDQVEADAKDPNVIPFKPPQK